MKKKTRALLFRRNLLIFGNPLVGNPIATEHINALAITSKLGCGSSILTPICWTRGRMMSAATVCDMKVAMTSIKAEKTINTP